MLLPWAVDFQKPTRSCLCCLLSMLTCFFKTSLSLTFWYSRALHTSLARVQGFSLIVTTHNCTALKVNGMTEDIFIIILGPGEVIVDLWIGVSPYPPQKKLVCLKHFCGPWWRLQIFSLKKKDLIWTKILFTTSRMPKSFASGLNLTKVQLNSFSICFSRSTSYPKSLSRWSNSSHSMANLYLGKYRPILYFPTANWWIVSSP